MSLQASSALPGLEPSNTGLAQPFDILLALGLLAFNVLLQPRAALSSFLKIDPATYRLLRILPFVTFIDAGACLVMIGLCLQKPERYVAKEILPTAVLAAEDDATDKHRAEKELSTEKAIIMQTKHPVRFTSKRMVRYIPGPIAGIQLFRLTILDGIQLRVFYAWALFAAYMFNELLYILAPNGLVEEKEQQTRVVQIVYITAPVSDWVIMPLLLALTAEFVQIAWLSRVFVPRTLWMDWGPPQLAQTDEKAILHFDIPPGTYQPVPSSGEVDQELVYGFWPSHTYSGIVAYSVNYFGFSLISMVFGSALGCAYFYIIVYLLINILSNLWYGRVFVVGAAWEKAQTGALGSRIAALTTTLVERIEGVWRLLPSRVAKIFEGMRLAVLNLLLMVGALLSLKLFWQMAKCSGGDCELVENWLIAFGFVEISFFMLDTPDGCYTFLAGMLIGGLTLVFRRWVIPTLAQKPHASVTKEARQYWTAVWTAALLCQIYTVKCCFFYFDTRGTKRPL